MPAFIKTYMDEKVWQRAKRIARESYPDISQDDDKFWSITTSIYKKLRGKKMNKTASSRVLNVLNKLAYVPLTPAAEQAMGGPQGGQPPVDPAMMGGAGAPMPPMDPAMMGGEGMPMPPLQGGGIQTVPGPNGEPIDPETGFIVVDPAQGVEMEPLTGLLFIKPAQQFVTPDGQPVPMEQAQQMIEQAVMSMQQGGGQPPMDPSTAGGQPPMDPAMTGGQPPMPTEAGAMPPEVAQVASGGLVTDPQSGLPIDSATGMFAQPAPASGAIPADGGVEEGLGAAMPGFDAFMDKYDKASDRQDKLNKRILHDLSGTRTDIQGLRRELQQLNDNQDTLVARLENLLSLIESRLSGGPAPVGP